MNTKSFILGFTATDSAIAGVSAAKRSIIHAVKSPVHGAQVVKTGVLNASEAVTSFLAGAKQAIKYRRGECRLLTADVLDVRSNEE